MKFAIGLSTTMLILSLGVCSVPADDQLLVGVAEVDITPPVGFRTGGGYGEVISTGVDDPLMAKAIVLRQGDVSAAMVISDLLSVPPDLSRQARERASRSSGIPVSHIVIAATHNHGSPEYWGSLRDIAHEAAIKKHSHDPHETIDYQSQLVKAWVEAIEDADLTRKPCYAELVIARQEGLAFNRRFHMRDGTVRFNLGVGNPDIVRPAGPVDPDLPVIVFRTNEDKTIATLTTFAMHTAVHGGTTFSGDFPAVLQRELREELGDGLISLFAEGTAGDINHIDVTNEAQLRRRPEVERVGQTLSTTVLDHLPEARRLEDIDLAVVSKTGYATFPTISESRYRETLIQLRDQKKVRQPFLTTVAAWRDCHRWRYSQEFPDGRKPLEVQAIRLNHQTTIVTLPHEVFVEIGMAIKATSPFRNTIVVSLSGDVDYYIPTRRAFTEGSYEVTTCPLDPGCGEILLDTARAALDELHQTSRSR